MNKLKFIAVIYVVVSMMSCIDEKQKDVGIIYINNQSDFDANKNSEFPPGAQIDATKSGDLISVG